MPVTKNATAFGTKQGRAEGLALYNKAQFLRTAIRDAVKDFGGLRILRDYAEIHAEDRPQARKGGINDYELELEADGYVIHPVDYFQNREGVFGIIDPVEKFVLAETSLHQVSPLDIIPYLRHQRLLGDVYGMVMMWQEVMKLEFDTRAAYSKYQAKLLPGQRQQLLFASRAMADLLSAPEKLLRPLFKGALKKDAIALGLTQSQISRRVVQLDVVQLAAVAQSLGIRFNVRALDIVWRLICLDLIEVKV